MTLFEKPTLRKGVQEVAPSELVKRIIASPTGTQNVLVLKTNPSLVIADIIKSVKSTDEARKIRIDYIKAKYSKNFEGSLVDGVQVGVAPTVIEEPVVVVGSSGNPSATFKGVWLLVLPREGYSVKEDFSLNKPLKEDYLA